MRYTEFTVGLSRTVNLGNFESARFEISLTVDVADDGEDWTASVREAQAAASALLKAERYRLLPAGDQVTVTEKVAAPTKPADGFKGLFPPSRG